jgi:TetR/AcrR family transcriptional regulator
MLRKAKAPTKVRHRRLRADIREALLKSALVELGAKGFDGASSRGVFRRISRGPQAAFDRSGS